MGKQKAEMVEDYPAATDQAKLGIQARGTGRLRRRLSIATQSASVPWASVCTAGQQHIVERWSTKPGTPTWPDDLRSSFTKLARREGEFPSVVT